MGAHHKGKDALFAWRGSLTADRCFVYETHKMSRPEQNVAGGMLVAGGYWRWGICILLLLAAIINYVDRQVIGILKPTLTEAFHWSDERVYSSIVFSFQLAYALGFIFAGRFMDAVGVRIGFATSVTLWSVAATVHGFAGLVPDDWRLPMLNLDAQTGFAWVTLSGGAVGLALARFALGLGESGAFPASIKTVAEWFPKRERALATGIFNAGTNVGALITPLLIPWITLHLGWQWAFILTGLVGFAWVAAWLVFYREPERHPRLKASELAYIRSDPPDPADRIPWRALLPHRQTWAFAVGKFMTDPIWWLYLFWIPDFFHRNHGLDLKRVGLPLVIIYLVADVGSIGGGWISGWLMKRGWTVDRARKTAMLICALSVVPVMFAAHVKDLWIAVGLISLAAAAHQGWSANLFTLTSDMFPRKAVGSVVGIGGTAGAIGGMFIAMLVGAVLQATQSYIPVFIMAGCAYLVALLVIHLLVPRLQPARLAEV
ncbi:MAG: MFS transporter [Verrucomicrobiota bacterium]|nr:MFS transporter [Limisphaera sp.]MDW8380753.1 MFS transporter [Verrucomicrobiota bacterium]